MLLTVNISKKRCHCSGSTGSPPAKLLHINQKSKSQSPPFLLNLSGLSQAVNPYPCFMDYRFHRSAEKMRTWTPSQSLRSSDRLFVGSIKLDIFLPFRKGPNRFLTVTKKDGPDKPQHSMLLNPSHNTLFVIHNLLERFPISNKERVDMQLSTRSAASLVSEAGEFLS